MNTRRRTSSYLIALIATLAAFLTISSGTISADIETEQISASADDAQSGSPGFNTTNTSVNILQGPSRGFGGFIHRNIDIPAGSTINSVTWSFRAFGTTNVNHDFRIRSGITNPVNFVTQGTTCAGSLGAQHNQSIGQVGDGVTVTWSSSTFPAMITEIQAIINLPGWSSGDGMEFCLIPNAGQTLSAEARSWDLSPAQSATLTINFTPPTVVPTLTTEAASDITETEATGNGTISDTGGEDADERGFVWGTASLGDPGNTAPGSTSYDDFVTESGTFGAGSFTGLVDGLTTSTTYYYRSFAHNSVGYAYGDEEVFTTSASALGQFMQNMIVVAATIFFLLFLMINIRWYGINLETMFMTAVIGFVLIIVMINLDLVS